MAWLNDHPPARSQFRHPRREPVSGVIAVHTAENTPDYVAFDGGAEAVARFIQGRDTPGSYHELCDSDSYINLVEWTDEAFHDGTGTNPHSLGLSFATRADVWPLAPKAWRDGAINIGAKRAAAYAKFVRAERGIIIPTRRLTAEQARNRVPGFVTHALLDPTRRTDPGSAFPWEQFFARYTYHLAGTTPAPTPEDDMAKFIKPTKDFGPFKRTRTYVSDGITSRWVLNSDEKDRLVFSQVAPAKVFSDANHDQFLADTVYVTKQ